MQDFMKTALGAALTSSKIVHQSPGEFGSGTAVSSTSRVQPKASTTRGRSSTSSIATAGSVASLNTGLPGMPHHGAVLKAEMGAGSGGWTGNDVQITGEADLTEIDVEDNVSDELQATHHVA